MSYGYFTDKETNAGGAEQHAQGSIAVEVGAGFEPRQAVGPRVSNH